MKMTNLSRLIFLILFIGLSQQQNAPRVETNVGVILGSRRTSETGKDIFSFTGIPYIEPPIGQLRFKPPVPAKPFTNDFSATKDDALCPQILFSQKVGNEDCVILNVFTTLDPSLQAPAEALPVMVWIHGGGFLAGSSISSITGMPDYLLEHDVVLVTINYRLGVLGFLSTEDEEAPGNYGLLDQVEALKWVKNHIAAFGGNPDKVTIFGESSGGGSVHYLVLSPLAKDLFHQAIAQSGTTLNPWSRTTISGHNTNILAQKLNCSTSSSSEILECLREKDALELVATDVVEEDKRANEMQPLVWIPRIDHEAESPFLPTHSIDIMNSGEYNKVPFIIGQTKDEGGVLLALPKEAYEIEVKKLTNNWDNICKVSLATREYKISEEEGTQMCNQIKDHYIDSSKTFEQNKLQYVKMLGDLSFVAGIHKTIELMADHISMYSYSLDYDNGHMTVMQLFDSNFQYPKGIVDHGDDLMYLFKHPQTNWTTQSPAYKMVQMMTKIWTDFAKTGEANIPNKGAWPKANSKNSKYVALDLEPTVEKDYRPEDMEFMSNIYSQSLFDTSIGNSAASLRQFLLPILLLSFPLLCVIAK